MTNFLISCSKAFMLKFGHLLGLARDETTPEAKCFWRLKDTDSFYTNITEFLCQQISWCNANKAKLKDFLPLRTKEIISGWEESMVFSTEQLVKKLVAYKTDEETWQMS